MFGSFFIATVLTALIAQLGSIADSIIIGHLVSPDALSVVRIWQPVENFMYIMIGMMGAGACFLSARGIGAQDYHQVNRVFNHHLYYVIVSALFVIVLLLPFVDEVANLVTTNDRLQPMLRPYVHAEFFAIFVAVVSGVLLSYIISNGNPRLVTQCIVISQVLNILFDLLFCGVFKMGIAGASYATASGDLIAFISLLPYMRDNSRIFRLHRPEKICSIKQYRECFSIGVPMLISALLAPVLFYIMNTLIIDKLGADGMYIFTVFFQINSICLLVLSGTNTVISNIGGILIGEEDYDSFRLLTRRLFRLLTVTMLVESLLIFLFPEVLAWMFGATDSLIEQSRTPFRLMCLALLVMVAMAYVVHRRNPFFSWPTLQTRVPSNPAATFSLPYTAEGIEAFLTQVHPFVEACELPDGMAVDMALEELLYEIVESNTGRNVNQTFDVHIIDKDPVFTVVVKSKGPLRNPIYKYSDDKLMNIDSSDMRLAILSRVCKNINHKYMNGINCIYLNYYRNEA